MSITDSDLKFYQSGPLDISAALDAFKRMEDAAAPVLTSLPTNCDYLPMTRQWSLQVELCEQIRKQHLGENTKVIYVEDEASDWDVEIDLETGWVKSTRKA